MAVCQKTLPQFQKNDRSGDEGDVAEYHGDQYQVRSEDRGCRGHHEWVEREERMGHFTAVTVASDAQEVGSIPSGEWLLEPIWNPDRVAVPVKQRDPLSMMVWQGQVRDHTQGNRRQAGRTSDRRDGSATIRI